MENIYPVITLYQPWATWIMREWKTIETRTHNRFRCLKNKTILIHSGLATDIQALKSNPYLTRAQLRQDPDEMINGFILGSAFVKDFRILTPGPDEVMSLIECQTPRYGLILENIQKWPEPIAETGQIGVWYYDLEAKIRVKKPIIED